MMNEKYMHGCAGPLRWVLVITFSNVHLENSHDNIKFVAINLNINIL